MSRSQRPGRPVRPPRSVDAPLFRAGQTAVVLAAALLAGCSTPASQAIAPHRPTEHRCGQAPVMIIAEGEADAALACEGAAASLAFLASNGTAPAPPIVIEISSRLPAGISATAIAVYSKRTGRITVMHYDGFARRGVWLRTPIERQLYRSLFAHEVAHAAAVALAGAAGLDTAAHEYIAYVAMFATMSPALRERVLARFDEAGFSHDLQINSMVYAFDPEQFGVDSWRHFSALRDRAGFLRRVLDGQALREPRPLAD